MDNKHLNNEQLIRCAESLIMTGSISFSKKIRQHLDLCMTCSVQVQVKVDELKANFQHQLHNNLAKTSYSLRIFNKW